MRKKVKRRSFFDRFSYSNRNTNIFLVSTFLILLFCLTIGYSVLSNVLSIKGDIAVRPTKDIRITNITGPTMTNGAYENTNFRFSHDLLSVNGVLPNDNSTLTYTITIKNNGTSDMDLTDIINTCNDSNIYYELSGISLGDTIEAGTSITFTLTLKTRSGSNNAFNSQLQFVFEQSYMDITAPVITFEPEASNACNSSSFDVIVTATDDVEVKTFRYCQTTDIEGCNPNINIIPDNSEDPKKVSQVIKIETESDYNVICVQAVDGSKYGPNSNIKCSNEEGNYYSLDTTGPEISNTITPTTADGSNGWYKTLPVVNITGTDLGCGTYTGYKYQTSIDGNAYSALSTLQTNDNSLNSVIASNECKTIQYKVTGYDGNNNSSSTYTSNSFKYDKTAPVITVDGHTSDYSVEYEPSNTGPQYTLLDDIVTNLINTSPTKMWTNGTFFAEYLSGENNNNYVYYAGYMWRIVSGGNGNKIKLVANEPVTYLSSYVYWSGIPGDYTDNYIKRFLDDEFYNYLNDSYNEDDILIPGGYDFYLSATGYYYNDYVGLLSADEIEIIMYETSDIQQTYLAEGFSGGTGFMALMDSLIGNSFLYYDGSGEMLIDESMIDWEVDVRPVILLSPETKIYDSFGGDGTIDNPYQIVNSSEAPTDGYTIPIGTAIDNCGDTPTVTTSGSVNTSVPGNYLIKYNSTDNAGNSTTLNLTVKVLDKTNPQIIFDPTSDNACHSSSYNVTLTATDDVEVTSLLYCQTTGNNSSCTPTITANPTGTSISIDTDSNYHVICAQATDSSGNITTECSNSDGNYYSLDTTGPEISNNITPTTADGSNGWYKTLPVVNITGSDLGCGTYTGYKYQTSIDGNAYSALSALQTNDNSLNSVIASNECKTIQYKVTGYDGNNNSSSTYTSNSFKYDKTAPVITVDGHTSDYSVDTYIGITSFEIPTGSVSDNCGATLSRSGSVNTTQEGSNTITYTATDNAGNETTLVLTVNVIQVYANQLEYSNSTYTTCSESQCALDELYGKLK